MFVVSGGHSALDGHAIKHVRFARRAHSTISSLLCILLARTMDGPWEDESDGLHELIGRSLVHRRVLWALVLATYRVELTQLLDHAAKNGFGPDDRALVIDLAIRIASVADEVELAAMHADALSLRNHAANGPEGEVGERYVLVAGLRLIERVLETERARQMQEEATESARPN